MSRILLIVCFTLFAPLLAAQSGYQILVHSGVGDVVAPPYTRVSVQINRGDTRAFVGRVVVDSSSALFRRLRRGRAPDSGDGEVSIIKDVTMQEGAKTAVVNLDVPLVGMLTLDVRLERQVSPNYYETVAEAQDSPSAVRDQRRLVGFVTTARLKEAQPYLFFRAVEIPVDDLPDSWKALSGFHAIVLNDDRLSRAQSRALIDYVTAGGTVVISPSSAASFNPETPAGSLLRISSTTTTRTAKLSDFADLLTGVLREAGTGVPMGDEESMSEPGEATDTAASVHNHGSTLAQPPADAPLVIWPESGRAKPVPGTGGLVSIARVGAGNLVLLHADISASPFTTSDNLPTTAAVKLLDLAIKPISERSGHTPMRLLIDRDTRDAVDIAGNRIPGRNALVVILLLYIAIAGVGMFIVARRIRKPELYPATLLLAALVSVGLVFGLGELYKRSGDRVKSVRVLVSDETTSRNALFSLGCAYATDGQSMTLTDSPKGMVVPAAMETRDFMFGMPGDPLSYTTRFGSDGAKTTVEGLDRWQNVFFVQREPANLDKFSIGVTAMEGGIYKVDNLTSHELHACVLLVGKGVGASSSSSGATCEWHYVSKIGPVGGPDASVTFSAKTRIPIDVEPLAQKVGEDTSSDERQVLGAMFAMTSDNGMTTAYQLPDIEARLFSAGLLPDEGEFLLISVLPSGALNGNSLKVSDVDDSDVSEVDLWMVRGGIESR